MDQQQVIGTCRTMCPLEEFKMREREGLLHKLELPTQMKSVGRGRARSRSRPQGRHDLAVKEYCRPAAGRSDPDPSTLRPAQVLHSTVHYLLSSVVSERHSQGGNWNVFYDFVFDRLRAVRQDLVVQGLSGQDAVVILEACVSFLVYAAYRLCETRMETFDPVINHQHTQECLKRLLCMYMELNSVRQHSQTAFQSSDTRQTDPQSSETRQTDPQSSETRQTDPQSSGSRREDTHGNTASSAQTTSARDGEQYDAVLDSGLTDLTLSDHCQCRQQAEFESVYLLYNLGDMDALRHFLSLPRSFRTQHLPWLAYQMSVEYLRGNTLRVLRLAARLPSMLCLCAFHRHLASLQTYGLKVLCTAHTSKNCRYPLDYLAQVLSFNSEDEARAACEDNGLQVTEGHVHFIRKLDTVSHKVCSRSWDVLEDRLISINLHDLLLGDLENSTQCS